MQACGKNHKKDIDDTERRKSDGVGGNGKRAKRSSVQKART